MGAVLVVDLRRLEQAPVEVTGRIGQDDPLWEGAGVELATAVAARARAEGSPAHGVWVRGDFSGRIRTACRRCLAPLDLEVSEHFEVLFDPKASRTDEDVGLYSLDARADELDLRPALRERFLLAVPDFPLCRETCSGLCPICGTNLNEGSCECDPSEVDPRWSPLERLRGGN